MPGYPVITRRIIVLLIMLGSTARLSAQTDAMQQAPVAGNLPLAAGLPVKKNYDEAAKSWFAVYNTGNIIHIYLAVTDPLQQRKIVTNGIELWIDTKGKKNKKTGIAFPFITHDANERPPQGPGRGFNQADGPDHPTGADTNNIQQLKTVIARQKEMKLTGFKEDLNGIQNIQHPSGILVSLYFIKDTLVYDAQLPVNIFAEPLPVNSRISICLVEKGMTMPGFGGNEMPPDGGGGDGMMPPPGGPPPGGEDAMRLFQDDIIWYKFLFQ